MQDLEARYQESLDFLYSFIDYSLKRNFRNAAENFNLDRMRHFMSLMGDPQKDYGIIQGRQARFECVCDGPAGALHRG